ncbi:MAG: CotH kinase family protein [Chitinispirillales bacterium]|jgi:hypothetical protein|nr:CotH kinase family protein [Chitinispirillales bacterium]
MVRKNKFLKTATAMIVTLFLSGNVLAQENEGVLLILQIGAGSDGNISHSFVELYNATESPIDLNGYSLQYAAGTKVTNGATQDGEWKTIDLSGKIIEPKHSFLILGKKGTMVTPALLIEDDCGDINDTAFELSNKAVKVALMSDTNLLNMNNPFDTDGSGTKASGYIDMIGVTNDATDQILGQEGSISFIDGEYRISKQVGVRRKSLVDTDNNSADFEIVTYASVSSEEKELKRPKNHSYGAWEPIPEKAEPVLDPTEAGPADILAGKLLILQAGAATDGAISNSFVEIYNNTDQKVSLTGKYSLQYANATGTGWNVIKLTGTIPAKSSFLIRGKTGTPTGSRTIVDYDQDVADFTLGNKNFKVVLMGNQNKLTVANPFDMDEQIAMDYVDMLGAVDTAGADNIDGYENELVVGMTKNFAVRRVSLTDSDNNKNDFETVDYRPANTNDDNYAKYKPKSRCYGAWDPVSGEGSLTSGLPIIWIDTQNEAAILDKINYVPMNFVLTDPNNPNNNTSLTADNFSAGGIRGRGNDSWGNPNAYKKSYRVKFDKKQSLFGLELAKSWVLIAQYRDPTLMFNTIAFEYGNRFGLPFNHSFNFVELYLNGEYKGNYLLTEQNQVNPGRVDINETEGWFVEMDGYYDEEPKFKTANYNLPVMIKSPEFEPANISNPAFDFVRKDLNELCDFMASVNFPENGYRDLINMNTFVDFIMIQEVTHNRDVLEGPMSTYLYKDNNNAKEELNRINMGPLWDFDCGYGYDYNYNHFNNPNKASSKIQFFKRFFDDPIFLVKYKERWNEKYQDIISINDFIDATAAQIEISAIKNFDSWWYRTFPEWTRNHPYEKNDFWEQIEKMKDYLTLRIAYLDVELNKVDVIPANKTFASQTFLYSEIQPQKFTLVAYDDMTELSATLKNENLSDFEISTELSKTEATGDGGYLATINVNPKNSLSAATHIDTLILSGENQGNPFTIKVPLSFVVNKETGAATAVPVLANKTHNSITIEAVTAPENGQTVEFAINTANTTLVEASAWKTDLTFTGLLPATNYYIFARTAENSNYNTGIASLSLHVITNQEYSNPISKDKKSDKKYGIPLEKAIVSQTAKILVRTPEQAQVTLIIYDNIGNVVFESKSRNNKEILWDLTNNAGRNVANGTYLIVVEAKGASGKTYKYSTKLGVKR